MLLFINTCVRDGSRTLRLANHLLEKLKEPVTEVKLNDLAFTKSDEEYLEKRDQLVKESRFDDPLLALAGQFAAADTVVIAAPFWDLSFPASLKQYFEQINIVGITFYYTPEGIPRSLCRAKRLFYVTTAGGPIYSDAYGFGYVKALAEGYYQIPEIYQIQAENLDIQGVDVEKILREAEAFTDNLIETI